MIIQAKITIMKQIQSVCLSKIWLFIKKQTSCQKMMWRCWLCVQVVMMIRKTQRIITLDCGFVVSSADLIVSRFIMKRDLRKTVPCFSFKLISFSFFPEQRVKTKFDFLVFELPLLPGHYLRKNPVFWRISFYIL